MPMPCMFQKKLETAHLSSARLASSLFSLVPTSAVVFERGGGDFILKTFLFNFLTHFSRKKLFLNKI